MRIDGKEALKRGMEFVRIRQEEWCNAKVIMAGDELALEIANLITTAVSETKQEAAEVAAAEYEVWKARAHLDMQTRVAGMGASATICGAIMIARSKAAPRTVTTGELLSAVLACRVREGQPHIYLSTMCTHDRHGECRQACKGCNAKCICVCHSAAPSEETNA